MEYNLKKLVDLMWERRKAGDFSRKGLSTTYRSLTVKASIGMTGNLSKIPWISYCAEGQETINGIYPVILYYGTEEFFSKLKNKNCPKKIILAYGISASNKGTHSWGTATDGIKTIGQAFDEWKYETNDYSLKKYNKSYVFKSYDWTDNVDYEAIQKDVDEIINIYSEVLKIETPSDIVADDMGEYRTEERKPMIQKIYFGTPGGGKSHKVRQLIELEYGAKRRTFRTTFHPDTDYASFVGGYKPVMKGKDIVYAFIPQVFTLAYIAAWNDPDQMYFLDIEEINRGNCAQIFGDLFQLLDRDKNGVSEYPIKADADLCQYLMEGKDKSGNDILTNKDGIANGELKLPSNLSIVATMNTSDQSLFPMDSAFKRRWDWEYVPSTFNNQNNFNITIGRKTYKWHDFLREANKRIKESTDSEDKQMGTFFVKTHMDEEKFKSKVLFYLWSEICKDEYGTPGNFFFYEGEDEGEKKKIEFSFNELYNGTESTKILQKFMHQLGIMPVREEDDTPQEETEDSTEDTTPQNNDSEQ